ncbi:MAG TPA: hypothetical protein DCG33_02725 [Prevotellaceae bacterium]|nr:hypothetical protein [Prevotellaceae bacterium]
MAILIKGMKMPDSCGECPLHDGEYGWCNANTDIVMSFDERPRSCPLAEAEEVQDAVSRQAVLDKAYAYGNGYEPDGFCVDVEDIQALPSVQPDIKQAAKLLSDFIESCPGGESYLITPDGEELRTDWGYATEGIQLIYDWAERRANGSD